jgi:hypothetical protein
MQTATSILEGIQDQPGKNVSQPKVDQGVLYKEPNSIYVAPKKRLFTLLFYGAVCLALLIGWLARGEEYIIAKSGTGYLLGILGGLTMLMLLLYPLRKKMRFMHNFGSPKHWFRVHMIMGIIGPVLIIFHTNFKFGSINSTVVLVLMILVTLSGLVGRYIYIKIHYGLYGKRATLEGLRDEREANCNSLTVVLGYAPKLRQRLQVFEATVMTPPTGVMQSIKRLLIVNLWRGWTHLMLMIVLRKALKVVAKRSGWIATEKRQHAEIARRRIRTHLDLVRKIAEFGFYEKLFSLWHLFHLPLFIMLVIAGIIHVFAVHMY